MHVMNSKISTLLDLRYLLLAMIGIAISWCHASADDFVHPDWQTLKTNIDEIFPHQDEKHVTGGVVIAYHNKRKVFEGAYGNANREWNIPWTSDTQFWTASVAKSFAAQIVIELSNKGLVDLKAPITDYIPEFPDYENPVRVWHLLAMRSGLNEDSDSQHLSGNAIGGYGGPGMTKDEILEFIYSQKKPIFKPGASKAHYENVAYSVLDKLIENVTKQHFLEALAEHITKPMGLKATGAYEWNHFWSLGDKAATAYIALDGQSIPSIETEMPYTYLHAGGIMYTTPSDLAKWAVTSAYGLNGQRPLFEQMTDMSETGQFDDSAYFFGIRKYTHHGHDVYAHGGYVGNIYLWVPSLDLVAIAMTNEVNTFSTSEISRRILDGAMDALDAKSQDKSVPGRPFPGIATSTELRSRDKDSLAKTLGVFINKENGHIIASFQKPKTDVVYHTHDGARFALEPQKSSTTFSADVSYGGKINVEVDGKNLIVQGFGHAKPTLFERVRRVRRRNDQSVIGIFYNDEWGSKYEIRKRPDGALELWTGDRSIQGRRPLKQITEQHWIAGSLDDGKFWSLKFIKTASSNYDEFIFNAGNVRHKRFKRLVYAD